LPDGEGHIELQETVRGHDVYLIQPTRPPVAARLLELLLLAAACRRAGAAHLTAVVPYFGYARLIADLLQAGGLHRVSAVDLHTTALEGFFPMPVEHLSAVSLKRCTDGALSTRPCGRRSIPQGALSSWSTTASPPERA
jgi:ribose-phosphate pyrophosphokinase